MSLAVQIIDSFIFEEYTIIIAIKYLEFLINFWYDRLILIRGMSDEKLSYFGDVSIIFSAIFRGKSMAAIYSCFICVIGLY
jgi:hypothetical protein